MYSLVNLFCLPFLDCHSLVLPVSMPSHLKRNGNMATNILGVFKTCSYLTVSVFLSMQRYCISNNYYVGQIN